MAKLAVALTQNLERTSNSPWKGEKEPKVLIESMLAFNFYFIVLKCKLIVNPPPPHSSEHVIFLLLSLPFLKYGCE